MTEGGEHPAKELPIREAMIAFADDPERAEAETIGAQIPLGILTRPQSCPPMEVLSPLGMLLVQVETAVRALLEALRSKLESGALIGRGFFSSGGQAERSRSDIPAEWWEGASLEPADSSATARGSKVNKVLILPAPPSSLAAAPPIVVPTPSPSVGASGRRGRSYAIDDAALLREMHEHIKAGTATGAQDAARLVVSKAPGSGTIDSKTKRLATKYNSQFSHGQSGQSGQF